MLKLNGIEMTHYICNSCHRPFFIPRYKGVLKKEEQRAEYCPYCGQHGLFNVSFEERMGTI